MRNSIIRDHPVDERGESAEIADSGFRGLITAIDHIDTLTNSRSFCWSCRSGKSDWSAAIKVFLCNPHGKYVIVNPDYPSQRASDVIREILPKMLIAAPASQEIAGDGSSALAASPGAAPQSALQVPHQVSLFDLLLSQFVGPSDQSNSKSSHESARVSGLVTQSHRSVAPTPHVQTNQKQKSAVDQVTTNPLTNLLFMTHGPAFQKGTAEKNAAPGINSNQIHKTIPHREIADTTPTGTAAGISQRGVTGSQKNSEGRLGTDAATSFGLPQCASTNAVSDPVIDTLAVSKAANSIETPVPPMIPKGDSPIAGSTHSANAGRKQFESILIRPESSDLLESSPAAAAAMRTPAAPSFESGFIVSIENAQARGKPVETAPSRVEVASQHPTESPNDVVVPMSTMRPTLNLAAPAKNESAADLSGQLASAITENLATASENGQTTINIRLDRSDLGTIQLQLSVASDDVVSIRILTDNQQVQQIVESQMAALRQSLTGNGIACGEFQVGCHISSIPFSNQKPSSRSVRSTELFSPSGATGSTTLKFPRSLPSSRVNFVA